VAACALERGATELATFHRHDDLPLGLDWITLLVP